MQSSWLDCFVKSEILNRDTESTGNALSLEKRSEILYQDHLSSAALAEGADDALSLEKRSRRRHRKKKKTCSKRRGRKKHGKHGK